MRLFTTLLFVLVFNAFAFCQGDKRLVFNAGLLILEVPSIDIGTQLKHYVFDDSTLSNYGPGVSCEFNFGLNSGPVTIGPKVYYQFDKHLFDFGYHKTSVFIAGRLSLIYYINSAGSELRLAPEVGLSLYDSFTVFYGYNFGFANHIPEAVGNRITMLLTLFGKERKGGDKELAPLH